MNDSDQSIVDEFSLAPSLRSFQIVVHWVCISTGIPINAFVALAIIGNRRMHKVRHVIWLGVIAANLFTLCVALLEYLAVSHSLHWACLGFCLMASKPYTLVLFNFIFVSCERLFYMTYPLVHNCYMTVPIVLSAQFGLSALIILLTLIPYVYYPLQCRLDARANKPTRIILPIFHLLCLVLKIVVYRAAKKTFRCSSNQPINGITTIEILMTELPNRNASPVLVRGERYPHSNSENSPYFVHYNSKRLSKMELNATLAYASGIIPLILLTFLIYFFAFYRWIHNSVFGDSSIVDEGFRICRELLLVHVCSNTLVYVFCSGEFRNCLRKRVKCLDRRS